MPLPSMAGCPIPSLKPNEVRPVRELVAVLTPDHFNSPQVLIGGSGPVQGRRQPGGVGRQDSQRHMHSRASQRLLPCRRAALRHVTQLGGAGRHALAELGREALE